MARSAYSRFRDNMGRAERRLKEALRNEDNTLVRQAYQNQLDRIGKFKEKVAEQNQKGKLDINEALEQWKNRKDLSGGKKTSLDVEKRRLQSAMTGDMTQEEIGQIFEGQEMSADQQAAFEALMKYGALKGTYVGQSADGDERQKAMNLQQELQEIKGENLDDQTMESVKAAIQELGWALEASGNSKNPNFMSGVLGSSVNRTIYEGEQAATDWFKNQ